MFVNCLSNLKPNICFQMGNSKSKNDNSEMENSSEDEEDRMKQEKPSKKKRGSKMEDGAVVSNEKKEKKNTKKNKETASKCLSLCDGTGVKSGVHCSSAGRQKSQKYEWKDANIALFGSQLQQPIEKDSAANEPAWISVKECAETRLFIWRIEKFQVKEWPRNDYGRFFAGDSYILLNVIKEEDALKYDIHFWIGKYSTNDEYGTAAYKVVELNIYLDEAAIQHREIQGFESDLFKSYFDTITTMKGGCASGFHHVNIDDYLPRLLHFKGLRRNINVVEVKLTKRALNSGDVFILDLGTKVYLWNGITSNKDERIKAARYLQQLEIERNGKTEIEILEENEITDEHKFFESLPDIPYHRTESKKHVNNFAKSLFRLSNESGEVQFSIISEGNVSPSFLEKEDIYIIDSGISLFVYLGKGASEIERQNAFLYAHKYLTSTKHSLIPVTVVKADQTNTSLTNLLDLE